MAFPSEQPIMLDPPGLFGPRSEISRRVAEILYNHMPEIEELSNKQEQIYQNQAASKYEWCRLVAMLLEDAFLSYSKDIGANG